MSNCRLLLKCVPGTPTLWTFLSPPQSFSFPCLKLSLTPTSSLYASVKVRAGPDSSALTTHVGQFIRVGPRTVLLCPDPFPSAAVEGQLVCESGEGQAAGSSQSCRTVTMRLPTFCASFIMLFKCFHANGSRILMYFSVHCDL